MPEQLTKRPEVTLQILRSAGAECGTEAPSMILTACPTERLCKLPGGEIRVYGLAEASRMTQLTPSDLQTLVAAAPAAGVPPAQCPHWQQARARPWSMASP